MNIIRQVRADKIDITTQVETMTKALEGLRPNPLRQKSQLFTLLYPVIVTMLARDVTQKAILETLAENGLKLHPVRFKEMMATEAQKIQGIPGSGCDREGTE